MHASNHGQDGNASRKWLAESYQNSLPQRARDTQLRVVAFSPRLDDALVRELDRTYLRRLGRQVRRVREARGMTQEALAEAGVPVRTVQDIEGGKRDARATTLRRIAEALVVEVADLLPRR